MKTNFDDMYAIMRDLLSRFYPERTTTVTSSDTHFVIPAVKAMLPRKSRLMRFGRTNEGDTLPGTGGPFAQGHRAQEYYLAAQTEHKKKR